MKKKISKCKRYILTFDNRYPSDEQNAKILDKETKKIYTWSLDYNEDNKKYFYKSDGNIGRYSANWCNEKYSKTHFEMAIYDVVPNVFFSLDDNDKINLSINRYVLNFKH